MRNSWLALSVFLFIGCMAGCSGGGSTMQDLPDLAKSPDLATPATTVTWTTTVYDLQSMGPLSGVNVCIAPANQVCAMSNASGTATLAVPMNAQFMLSYTVSGYVPQLTEHTSTTTAGTNYYLIISSAVEGSLAGAVGKTIDNTKGHLVLSAVNAITNGVGVSGVTFAVTPAAGDGPYYFGATFPDPNAKSTSANGLSFVLNVPAGDYDVAATLTGKTCTGHPLRSWPGSSNSSVKTRAVTGSLTTISIVCQ